MAFWSSAKAHRGILLILVLYLLLGTLYSVVTPLFEASDEMWHYPFIAHLADGHGLPVQQPGVDQPWRQEGSQPPLYYALGALATFWVDDSDMAQVLWKNPHADIGIPKADRNVNMVVHTDAERFPYRGTALAVHIVRWLSVCLGAVTVLGTYLVALEVFPKRRPLALGAAAFVAFNPMFLFISGSINNDNLANALAAVTLWRAVRLIAQPAMAERGLAPRRELLLLGGLLGLAALSKASALGLFALVGLALALVAFWCWRRAPDAHRPQMLLRQLIWSALIVYGVAILIAGWWFVRNWRLYGDPLGLNTFVAIVGPRHPVPTLRQLWGERVGFTMSFWGFFGGMNVPMSSWLYRTLDLLAALGVVGVAIFLLASWRRLTLGTRLKLLLMAAWPAIVFASLIRWTLMTIATQGRLMFAALPAIAFWLVLGWMTWASRRLDRWAVLVVSVLFFAAGLAAPFAYIRPAYARPPVLTPEQLPSPAEITYVNATLGERMELIGYSFTPGEAHPGEAVSLTVYWRALAKMDQNYSVFVHLLTENDLIVGQRDMYPGQGTYPTTLWQAGDIVADTYVVPISSATLTPATAQFEVGLYLLESGERLQVADDAGQALGDQVRFGEIRIVPRTRSEPGLGDIPNPVSFNLDNKIELIGYALDRTAAAPGEAFHLTLYWRALARMPHDYSIFTQVLGENQQIWAQKDAWPQDGNAPTSTWQPGQVIEDRYELVVRQDAPAGAYDLQVGAYLGATGERLNLLGEGGHVQDDRILLGKVRIVRPAE